MFSRLFIITLLCSASTINCSHKDDAAQLEWIKAQLLHQTIEKAPSAVTGATMGVCLEFIRQLYNEYSEDGSRIKTHLPDRSSAIAGGILSGGISVALWTNSNKEASMKDLFTVATLKKFTLGAVFSVAAQYATAAILVKKK